MFVQWVRLARIIGRMLTEEGINFLYYFGSMTKEQRNKAVETFQDDPKATVMVSSRPSQPWIPHRSTRALHTNEIYR